VKVAVVDLGTNSTRLLVARVHDGQVEELARVSQVTRLGEGVDATGRLQDTAVERVHQALTGYRETIDRLGAERLVAVATSAVRDADNGEQFRAGLRERFGIDARTISGDEEARLTFLGATSGHPPGGEPLVVIDIGGGSTEYMVGAPGGEPAFHVSTQAGSVRHTERHAEVDAIAGEIRSIVEQAVPAEVRRKARAGIAVAGTPISLAAIDQRLDRCDPARLHGYLLSLDACERMLAMLAGMTPEERRRVPGLHPDRAPTIVAGVVILVESMRLFGLDAIETSEADILHGAALEAAVDNG